MLRILVVAVAGLIALATSVALYLGLVHAVPVMSWGTDEEELLRFESAHDVRLASVFAALAGVLLLTARARWTGGIGVAAAWLLAVLAHENTIASWALPLVYVPVLLVGCGAVVGRARCRPSTAPSPWARGHVGTWARGHVGTWARGHVGTWTPRTTGLLSRRRTGRTWQKPQAGESGIFSGSSRSGV